MKIAGIRVLENSISINAGLKARLDTAVSVSSLNSKREVLRLNPKGTRGLAAQSIPELLLYFWYSSLYIRLSHSLTACHACFSTVDAADQTQADLLCCMAEKWNNPHAELFSEIISCCET